MKKAQAGKSLGHGVAAVDAELGTGDVFGGVGEEEGYGAHKIFGSTHFADGDEGGPLVAEFGVFVEDFAGAVGRFVSTASKLQAPNSTIGDL